MNKIHFNIENEFAILSLKLKLIRKQSFNNIEKLYCLQVGSNIFANDSICLLLVFKHELWLLPELTPGLSILKKWESKLNQENKSVTATLDYLPYSWKTTFYILRVGRIKTT